MTHEDDELRDPPRLLEDPAAHEALRALARDARELTPPALPSEIHTRVRETLRARSTPSRAPWLALAAGLALAAAALLAWLGRDHGTRPALPPIVGDTDAALSRDGGLDAAIDAGPIEPRERVPWVEVSGNGCGLDMRVSLTELEDDVRSVALVIDELDAVEQQEWRQADCHGTIARELDAELFRRAEEVPTQLVLPLTLGAPHVVCGRTYAVSVCLRDALGRLAPGRHARADVRSTRDLEESRFVGRVETPSGPTQLGELGPRHVVTSFFFQTSPPWTTPGPHTPTFVEAAVRRIAERTEPSGVEVAIDLEGGKSVSVHGATRVWVSGRWTPAAAVVAGDVVLVREGAGVREARVAAMQTIDHADTSAAPWLVQWTLDVGYPHTYFVDGLLVHDDGAQEEGATSFTTATPSPREPIRAMPEPSWDCSLSSELVLEADAPVPASVAIVYAPHRGRSGARRALGCADGTIGAELPASLLGSIPPSPDGTRRLSVQTPGWDEEGRDWHALAEDVDASRPTPRSVECSSSYDVIACVRGTDGALTALPGAEGRWTLTGPACFARGTEITTPEGARPIETLRVGERVTSRDPETGEVREVEVRALVPRGTRPIRALELEGGRVLHVTDEHPLFDARTRAFREARALVAGDALLDADGHEVAIVRVTPAGSAPVYDLSVEAPHTFFAEGALAHNY
jgi:hypothetical protein